jgi:hypothetical protein
MTLIDASKNHVARHGARRRRAVRAWGGLEKVSGRRAHGLPVCMVWVNHGHVDCHGDASTIGNTTRAPRTPRARAVHWKPES